MHIAHFKHSYICNCNIILGMYSITMQGIYNSVMVKNIQSCVDYINNCQSSQMIAFDA